MEEQKISLLGVNTMVLHYWFNDESHTMNAVVQNKCEFEFLNIVKEIAKAFDAEIIIETEPFGEGGLINRLKVISKTEDKKGIITTTIITALATALLVT